MHIRPYLPTVLPRFPHLDANARSDSAASDPLGLYDQPAWLGEISQIVRNLIGDRFVKDSFVAKTLVVELEASEFDAATVRHIAERDLPKIGMARSRAKTCELIGHVLNDVVPIGEWVVEDFKQVWVGHDQAYSAAIIYDQSLPTLRGPKVSEAPRPPVGGFGRGGGPVGRPDHNVRSIAIFSAMPSFR